MTRKLTLLVAVVVSVALHGGVLLSLAWLASRGEDTAITSDFVLDTRAAVPEMEVGLIVYSPELPRPAPAPQAATSPPPVAARESSTPALVQTPSAAGSSSVIPAKGTEPTAKDRGSSGAQGAGSGLDRAGSRFFPVPAGVRTVVYVIDHSGSMGQHGFLTAAKQELLASLDQLPAATRFQVIVYNRIAEPLARTGHEPLLPATSESKRLVAQRLKLLSAEGATDHLQALKQALLLEPDVIFFLTDAGDVRAEDIRKVTAWNRGRVSIHTIELTTTQRRSEVLLQLLARSNHGSYQAILLNP